MTVRDTDGCRRAAIEGKEVFFDPIAEDDSSAWHLRSDDQRHVLANDPCYHGRLRCSTDEGLSHVERQCLSRVIDAVILSRFFKRLSFLGRFDDCSRSGQDRSGPAGRSGSCRDDDPAGGLLLGLLALRYAVSG